MLITLTVVVLLSAIALLFTHELSAYIKNWIKIPGVLLIVPLLLISYIVDEFSPVFAWYLHKIQRLMAGLVQFLVVYLPDVLAYEILIKIALFSIFIVLSLWVYPHLSSKRRRLKSYGVNPLGFAALWLFIAILFVTI